MHDFPEHSADGPQRSMRGRDKGPLGAPELKHQSVVGPTAAGAPLLQIARRLDLGGLQRLTVEEDDALQADAQETSCPAVRLSVQ